MAEIAVPNLKTFFIGTTRAGEVAGADWTGGVNRGASNAPGIGINTGDYNPKESDWPYEVRDPGNSQVIGSEGGEGLTNAAPITVDQGVDVNDQVSFVQATGTVAPDADIIIGVANKTGKTLSSGDWAWGLKAIA